MPFGMKTTCMQCEKTESIFWHNADNGKLCNDCHELTIIKTESVDESDANGKSECDQEGNSRNARKTTRAARYKNRLNNAAVNNKQNTKGKGRRSMFKGKPTKAPSSVATVVTSDFLYYKVSTSFK